MGRLGLVAVPWSRRSARNQGLDCDRIGADQVNGRLHRGRGNIEDQGPEGEVIGILGIDAGDAVEVVRHRARPAYWMAENLLCEPSRHLPSLFKRIVIDVNSSPGTMTSNG